MSMIDIFAVVAAIATFLAMMGLWYKALDWFEDRGHDVFDTLFWAFDLLVELESTFWLGVLALPAIFVQSLTFCLFGLVLFGTSTAAALLVGALVAML